MWKPTGRIGRLTARSTPSALGVIETRKRKKKYKHTGKFDKINIWRGAVVQGRSLVKTLFIQEIFITSVDDLKLKSVSVTNGQP